MTVKITKTCAATTTEQQGRNGPIAGGRRRSHRLSALASRTRIAVLMDLENLLQPIRGHPNAVRRACEQLVYRVEDPDAQMFGAAAAAHSRRRPNGLWTALAGALPGWIQSLVVEGGPDAADLALSEWLARRSPRLGYGRLVILSGDHHFAPVAEAARDQSRFVRVIARRGTLSHELARAADECVLLDVLPDGEVTNVA